MPRIPQGKFRTEPSRNVGTESFRRIDTGKNLSGGLRKLGGVLLGKSKEFETAKRTADALSSAEKYEKSYDSELEVQIDEIKKNSVNGKFKDSSDKETDTVEAVETKLLEFENKATAELSGDPEAMSYYQKYTQPKVDLMRAKVAKFQSDQITGYRQDQIRKGSTDLVEKFKATGNVDLAIQEYADKTLSSIGVVDRGFAEESIRKTYKALAYASTDYIKSNGFTKQTDAAARKYFKHLDGGERLAVERHYEKVSEQVQKSQTKLAYKNVKDLTEEIKTSHDMVVHNEKIQETKKFLFNTPLGTYETPDSRLDAASSLQGKELAMMAIGANQSMEAEDYGKVIEQMYDALGERGLASSSLAEVVGPEKLKQSIVNEAVMQANAYVDKVQNTPGGAFEELANTSKTFMADLTSQNPMRRDSALANMNEHFDSLGLPEEKRSIVSSEIAEEFGKNFDLISKGFADPTGDRGWDMIQEVKNNYGDMSDKAFKDYITLGKGTKKGSTKVPAIVSIAGKIQDETFGREIMMTKSKYQKNLMVLKEDGNDDAFKKEINSVLSESNYRNLFYGRAGEGAHLYEGMKESIQSLAAEYAAGEDRMSISDAVSTAMAKMDNELRVGKSDRNTVMVDKSFLKEHNIHENAINGMASSLGKLEMLDQAGVEIDFFTLKKMAKNNSFLSKHSDIWEKAGKLGHDKQREMIVNALGDSIMVSNDPNKPNHARIYLKPMNGQPIPMPMKTNWHGQSETLSVDLKKYYKALKNSQASKFTSRRGGAGGISMLNRMAQ